MNVRELRENESISKDDWAGWHVLTVAEAGFSRLDSFGRDQVGIENVRAFADGVNRRDEPGSLHPEAPISAIPRRFLRDSVQPDVATIKSFQDQIRQFIKANESIMRAARILVDFHVTAAPVPSAYVKATIAVFSESDSSSVVSEVVVLS